MTLLTSIEFNDQYVHPLAYDIDREFWVVNPPITPHREFFKHLHDALTTISKRIGHTITVTPNPCSHWGDSWHLTIDGELIAICSSEAEASDAASCWISLRSPTP